MDELEKIPKNIENMVKNLSEVTVHHVLAHSYSFYLLLFIVAIFLDTMYPVRLFKSSYMVPIGFVVISLASLLILWAQRTSRNLPTQNLCVDNFCKGPYRYTRSPTHWGLFFLVFGSGVVANAIYIVIFSVVSLVFTRLFFLKKEEKILAEKYGLPYLEYQKLVKL
jgi:protein-S-isoprenylcysteine O-methyltransferase Ste14